MLRPEASKTSSSWNRQPATSGSSAFSLDEGEYDDVAEVARTLTALGKGAVALDLALDLVLNEVVEQARLATGATGAAVALARDGEMVCRATTGEQAPGLGVRLEMASGLSGECLQTGEVQHCSDTETDPRVDAEACRQLGVRSAMLMPLDDGSGPFGILEVFSSRANAFGERDINTLHALALRVVASRNAAEKESRAPTSVPEKTNPAQDQDKTAEFSLQPPEQAAAIETASLHVPPEHEAAHDSTPAHDAVPAHDPAIDQETPRGHDVVTTVLVVLVIATAVTLGALLGWRGALLGSKPEVHPAPITASAPTDTAVREQVKPAEPAADSAPVQSVTQPKVSSPVYPAAGARGGLIVTQNGKVIYRLASPPIGRNVSGSGSISDETATRLIHRVAPEYPAEAMRNRIQGAVVLNVQVLGNGNVGQIDVASGDPVLVEAAIHAVRQWKYQPYVVDGQPVESQTRITIRFSLPNS